MSESLSLLITICFAFSIIILNLILNSQKSWARLIGASFFIPLALGVYSFLQPQILGFKSALILGDILLILHILIFVVLKPEKESQNIFFWTIAVLPLLIVAALARINPGPDFIVNTSKPFLVLASTTIVAMGYLYITEKSMKSILFRALCLLLVATLVRNLAVLYVPVRFLAFFCFYMYLYNEWYGSLIERTVTAEKRLKILEKSIEAEVKKRIAEIERSNHNLLMISRMDPLTKTYNKRAIINIIESLIRSRNTNRFAILLFDVDNFKTINDTLGHVTGDMVLKRVAHTAKTCIRDIDSLGRYGGDEFIIVLPNASVKEALFVAERFRSRVEKMETNDCTVSIGIAAYPEDGTDVQSLIAKADEGLYLSKRMGRNNVSYAGPGLPRSEETT